VLKDGFAPVWARAARGGGMVIASLGAFLVLEAREHAIARGAKAAGAAFRRAVRSQQPPGRCTKTTLTQMWSTLAPQLSSGHIAVISGASGAETATSVERAFFATVPRSAGARNRHLCRPAFEPQFVLNIALATFGAGTPKTVRARRLVGRRARDGRLGRADRVTSVGHWRGEGMALVDAVR